MSNIWDQLITLQNNLISKFEIYGEEYTEPGMNQFNKPGWINRTWKSEIFRRAHIDVVDARQTRSLWMMHCCIFPHLDNSGPIFGLDVIAGKNKVTGFFHDFSPTVDKNNELISLFKIVSENQNWKKERELPNWAKEIFSTSMIAVGNINTIDELTRLITIGLANCDDWLEMITQSANSCSVDDGKIAQNKYAFYQKQNPHTPKVMASLGLNESDIQTFIQESLFPDIR
jgi:Ferredoxin-dependent bilin reductase